MTARTAELFTMLRELTQIYTLAAQLLALLTLQQTVTFMRLTVVMVVLIILALGSLGVSGNGGNGGDGRIPGQGGRAGGASQNQGVAGANGQITSAQWGQAGADNGAQGGLAGSGILDSGATVVLFGESGRYVNGNGDHP